MRSLKAVVGLLIAALCLWLVFRRVDVAQVAEALGTFSPVWLLPALALYAADYWLRAERWRELLAPVQTARTGTLAWLLVLGNTVNNVLPARMGDVARAVLCKRRFGMSRSSALATIFVEKIFDGITTLGFFVVGVLLAPAGLADGRGSGEVVEGMSGAQFWAGVGWAVRLSAIAFGAALAAGIVAIVFRSRTAALVDRVASLLPGRLGSTARRFGHLFLDGLMVLKSPGAMAATAALSLVIWTAEAGCYWLIGLGFAERPPFAAILLLVALVNVAVTLPSSPGFWGPFELAVIGVLKLFGISGGVAVVYTLVTHLFLIVPLALAGAAAMAHEHLRWSDVRAIDRADEPPSSGERP